MLTKINIKCKIFYLCYIHYIWNLLSPYNIIRINPINTLIIKRVTFLLSQGKDIEFDVTDFQHLIKKLI